MLISTQKWIRKSLVSPSLSSPLISTHYPMKLTIPRTTGIAIAFSTHFHPAAQAFALIDYSRRGFLGHNSAIRHSLSSIRSSSSSAISMNTESNNKVFPTWSFDSACDTMQFTAKSNVTLSVSHTSSSASTTTTVDSDLIIVGVYGPPAKEEEEEEASKTDTPEPMLDEYVQSFNSKLGGAIRDLMMENYKTFQHGSKAGVALPTLRVVQPSASVTRLVILGLGSSPSSSSAWKEIEPSIRAKIGSAIASKCDSESKTKICTVYLPTSFMATNSTTTTTLQVSPTAISDLTSEFYTTLYSDNRYRTGDKIKILAPDLSKVHIQLVHGAIDMVPTTTNDEDTLTCAVAKGQALAWGQYLTKDIVNAPHNVLNSLSMANVARAIAQESQGRLTCTILGKKECEERGMGAYLGVARGSETEPQFIHLTYKPVSSTDSTTPIKKVAAIGKGLLFDTGGYNIKTAMMELMKFDCGGAAAVFGAARATAMLAPPNVEAHFIVAACENMISAKAMVPSDVLTASNGKTIEITNTDAEGRLTLADALVYADKEIGCESIIELSTLTGACMVALGKKMAGIWTDNDELAKELEDISKVTGDKSWRMPLEKEYKDQLESKIADLSNCGDRYGGAINAALFLHEFVSKKKPFAHIDIAGPVWNDKIGGATGYGAKLVTEWIRRQGTK